MRDGQVRSCGVRSRVRRRLAAAPALAATYEADIQRTEYGIPHIRASSDKHWVPGPFCQAQIDASPELTVERVSNRDGK